jgi:hypothetical protein
MGANPLAGNPLEPSGVEWVVRFHYQFRVRTPLAHQTVGSRPVIGRSAVVRVFAVAWLVLYAAFSVAIPLLDARMEHSANVVAHWEDAGATNCPVAHAPDCVACHVFSGSRSSAPKRPALVLARGEQERIAPVTPIGVHSATSRSVPSTRAPPSA